MRLRRWRAVAAAAALLPVVSGCGSGSDEDVLRAARTFYRAVASGNGDQACRMLAPPTRSEVESSAGQPCARAILGEGVQDVTGAPHVEVYASMAQVRWSGETTFVSRYDSGWRVYAAACSPDPSSPRDADRYDCDVKGG